MIKGIGTDLVNVDRIARAIDKHPEKFPGRILCPNEFQEFRQHKNQVNFLAKRFAAKEALVKALGTGFSSGISWHDIEVCHDLQGKPTLSLKNTALKVFNDLNAQAIHLSLSDELPYVQAFIVIE